MKPPCGKGLFSFQVSRLFETRLIRLVGIMLLGNGAVSPGARIARVAVGLASPGYQRLRGSRNSEKSPPRIATVGTDASAGVARRSRRASQLNSQKVLSRTMGPDATAPY